MNFSLPGIFILLHIVSALNMSSSVSHPTATLGLSPHQTDGQRVLTARHTRGEREGAFKLKLPILGLDLPAVLHGPRLLPPSELDAVAVNQLPVFRASGVAIAEMGEVPRVGVGHGKPEQGQQVEFPHVASISFIK